MTEWYDFNNIMHFDTYYFPFLQESLQALLPLYDSGSGSFYDMRHYSLPGTAPNLARWDYHTTHINQLLLLNTIEPTTIFSKTAERWIGYMKGHRAKHN